MKTITILVLLLFSLSQALPIKDKDPDDGFIEASDIGNFQLLPFLWAVKTSEELQWEVMRNWLMDRGILKLRKVRKPKKKLRKIRLF